MAFNPNDLEYMGEYGLFRNDAILWRYDRPDETSEDIFDSNYAVNDLTAAQRIRNEDLVWVTASDGDYISPLQKIATSQPPPVGPYRYIKFGKLFKVDAAALNFGSVY